MESETKAAVITQIIELQDQTSPCEKDQVLLVSSEQKDKSFDQREFLLVKQAKPTKMRMYLLLAATVIVPTMAFQSGFTPSSSVSSKVGATQRR